MSLFKPRNLQTKFIIGLAVIMAVAGVFFVYLLQQYLRETLEQETRGKAQVILRGVESLHVYVQNNLRPVMTGPLLQNEGLLEAMSCTALARAAMGGGGQGGGKDADSYRFRRVAIGARSPDLEAAGLERDFIQRFQRDSDLEWAEALVDENGQETFIMAQPVRYQGFCLRCHGDPADAPRDLVATFGADRGFGRKEGELAGAHVVRLPMRASELRIRGATLGFVLMFSVGALILFGTIYFFFNRLVVHNLRRAQVVMARHFPDAAPLDAPRTVLQRSDEIEGMLGSLEHFADSLSQARAQLKSYASNLESMVAVRTQDLSREAEARRADVGLFVNLLSGFNRSQDRVELLDACLELIARRFNAQRVVYCCTMASGITGGTRSWPDPGDTGPVPYHWQSLAGGGVADFQHGCANIPVQTPDTTLGVLTICWAPGGQPENLPQEVLLAVGQQLGVVLENMDALDNLLRQNDMLQAVFEGISDPVALLDGQGRVLLANRSAQALAGPDDGDGRPRLLGALGVEAVRLGDGGPPEALEEPVVREVRLPGDRTFMASLYPLPDYRGQGVRLVAYAREVTGERRMRELAQQNEKLLAVGRLAAGLAHEINNPLGVILFYGELLRSSMGEGQAGREDVEVILKHTRTAQKVLRDLLNFVRPRQAAPGPCDLAGAARQTAGVFQAHAAASGVSLEVDAPEGLPPVLADASALEQVLSNLLINALDAVPGGGAIAVRAFVEGGQGVLSVSDNGPGIAQEDLGRIFDPFFTTKEVGKGTGLGLAVVYGLVKDMGGTVVARSEGGAEFIVRLPLAGAKEGAGREAA
ncbi:c-type heme family protein [Fundidesulfovibrio agrisoli]|uniref:c-type heme family protein n=1 Tax=Fundidesulfovibrio agrisoli TaxID=2922717 RepID=UPI001FAB7916|nr:DUF3365 domain-containing protein [Fundidesulfovibrio agrisoli]